MKGLYASCVAFATMMVGCHAAGAYGHSMKYVPLDAEERALVGAREFDPVMAQRAPQDWVKKPVSLFGVVSSREDAGDNTVLTLTMRRLEGRNLCDDASDEDSCRVTVSDRDFGVIRVRLTLASQDNRGERAVGLRSLVRVVGQFEDTSAITETSPILQGSYYRHFPRVEYVTRASSASMRQ